MFIHLFSFLLISCYLFYATSLDQVLPKRNLGIGMISQAEDDIFKQVVNLAIKKINEDLSIFNYSLTLRHERIYEINNPYQIEEAGCEILSSSPVGFISTSVGMLYRKVSSFCERHKIPHFVIGCFYNDNELKNLSPMNINIYPYCKGIGYVINKYITEQEQWDRVVMVYENRQRPDFVSLFNHNVIEVKMIEWRGGELMVDDNFLMRIKSGNITNFLVDISDLDRITDFIIKILHYRSHSAYYSFTLINKDVGYMNLGQFADIKDVSIKKLLINEDYGSQMSDIRDEKLSKDSLSKSLNIISNDRWSKEFRLVKSDFETKSNILFHSIELISQSLKNLLNKIVLKPPRIRCKSSETCDWFQLLIDDIKMERKKREALNPLNDHLKFSVFQLMTNGFEKIESWPVNKSVSKINLKPEKLIRSLRAAETTYRVTTIVESPFVIYKKDLAENQEYDTNIDAWDGYCIELLKKISDDLGGLTFKIHVPKDRKFGHMIRETNNNQKSVKWNGMIGELIDQKADIAVSALTVSTEREKYVDFSEPFMHFGLSLLVWKTNVITENIFFFLSPFSAALWIIIILVYIILIVIIFFINRITPCGWIRANQNREHSTKTKCSEYDLNNLWATIGALRQQGFELHPRSHSVKMASISWWFFTLIVIGIYTSSLAALLITNDQKQPFRSWEELVQQNKVKYGTLLGGSSYMFFKNSKLEVYQKVCNFMEKNPDVFVRSIAKGVQKVKDSKGRYAFILESPMNDYYARRNCNLKRVGDLIHARKYAFAFPKGSALRDKVTKSILKLESSNKLEILRRKWWDEMNITEPCAVNEDDKNSSAGISYFKFLGLFLVLLILMIFALIIAFVELYLEYKCNQSSTKGALGTYFKRKFLSGSTTCAESILGKDKNVPTTTFDISSKPI